MCMRDVAVEKGWACPAQLNLTALELCSEPGMVSGKGWGGDGIAGPQRDHAWLVLWEEELSLPGYSLTCYYRPSSGDGEEGGA